MMFKGFAVIFKRFLIILYDQRGRKDRVDLDGTNDSMHK
jgi:hypothetical protein